MRGSPRDTLTKQNPVARRNAEKFGNAPNRIFLEFIGDAIGISDVPQHLYDFLTAIIIEGALQDTGKMVEIHRLAVALFRRRDQFRSGFWVEAESLLDDACRQAASAGSSAPEGGAVAVMDVATGELWVSACAPRFGEIRVAVHIGDMNEQGNRRETIILLVKAPGGRFRPADLGDKVLQGIEHSGSPIPVSS